MPTGYTAAVIDGKTTEFPEFAMSCARAFGALITMRDDPMDAPIPEQIDASTTYHDTHIASAKARLLQLQDMSPEDAASSAKAAHDDALNHRNQYLAERDIESARLNTMLKKVHAWAPPTPDHDGMKKFMIEQLTMSMPGDYAPSVPAFQSGEEWRVSEIKKAEHDIAYHIAERTKEIDRAESRTAWIKSLRASLAT